ncbi:MAG TPA: biotin carboxylase N-terminal domain-containing protein [Vicinamibacteria bacterium]|nr:biotin carboxylase N-terminal domain-containing protein [Vicinamibacteria bacterium]
MPPIRSVLIANRGEIALRVIRTCRAMGIRTVAVYSEADAGALHVREADSAIPIGKAASSESYLRIDRILEAAKEAGVDAIHPGYGFLSQNGDFADACAAAGFTFIGPKGDVHRLMGDKKAARQQVQKFAVPVVPGYDGEDQSDARLAAEASRIGFPLMIKPSRGGGGKGMHVTNNAAEFEAVLPRARRESLSSFGNDFLVLERFVQKPRHVEVQVLFDQHGKGVHLFERECSVQRRHQKVIEETPSVALDADLRQRLCAAGVAAAAAANYTNAGTVEFLLDSSGEFYFLEMNTRLQVEHPVTEMTLGIDLVRLQIEISEGKPLPFEQWHLNPRGHAIEARLNAEDPRHHDAPSPGRILHFEPPQGPFVRSDSGVATGSVVPEYYDPMIAKIIASGPTRDAARTSLVEALRDLVVLGIATNREKLIQILESEPFRSGRIHTGVLEEIGPLPAEVPPPAGDLALIAEALEAAPPPSGAAAATEEKAPDPWAAANSWRLA